MIHGGDIYRQQVDMDFSISVNPLGIPEGVGEALKEAAAHCAEYPDILHEELKSGIENMTGVSREYILCGNGASELLAAALRGVSPARVWIPVPSFGGYEYAAEAAGSECVFLPMKEKEGYSLSEDILDELDKEIGMLLFANPGNPTGKLMEPETLEHIIKECMKRNIFVAVDECFMEFTGKEETHSVKRLTDKYPNLIVIRAFTKSFAMPGVRLGYLFCGNRELSDRIGKQLPEWNLSVFAQAAGKAACREVEYIRRTVEYIERERDYLTEALTKEGIRVFPSQANFLLLQTSLPLYQELLKRKILIRDCESFRGLGRGYYRIAVRTGEENRALIKAVRDIRDSNRRKVEFILPGEIEKRSFEIIEEELQERNILLPKEQETVIKRVIHTSADFEYAHTMAFSEGAVKKAKELILNGADIITDTNMGLAGINKKALARYGGEVRCFMAEEAIACAAKERQITRAAASMEKAAGIKKPLIFAIGNAPTALLRLYEMIQAEEYVPEFIIGVPVGFVNVVAAKELIQKTKVPYIINLGRKGGSNVAAAICNALLYELER